MRSARAVAYISLTLTMVFWGFTFVLYKIAYESPSMTPSSVVFLRLFFSLFFLFGFAVSLKRLKKIRKKDLKWFLLMALFEPFFYFLGESNGMTMVSATVGAIIISTIPLVVPVASYYFFRERLSPLNIAGMLISFAGVMMVVLNKGAEGANSLKGILLMLLAVVSATGYTLLAKKLIVDYNPITLTSYQSLFGLFMYLPLFLVNGLPELVITEISTKSWLAVGYLGVFGSGICFILLTIGIRELGASKSNIFANIVPVVAAIISFFLLSEAMPVLKITGIAVTIIGLLMSQLGSARYYSSGIAVR